MDTVKNLAKDIGTALSSTFLYDPKTKRPFPSSPLYADNFNSTDPNSMMMIAGMTGPVGGASKIIQAQKNVLTGPHSVYKGVSGMAPTQLEVYDSAGNLVRNTKKYSSLKKALDVARNHIELPEGGRAFPQTQTPSYAQVLVERIEQLRKGGYSTANAEKALKEELKAIERYIPKK